MIRRRRRTLLTIILFFVLIFIYIHQETSSSVAVVPWTIIDEIHREDHLRFTPKSCFTKEKKEIVRRAILIHFPVEYSIYYLLELKWLYLSWIETLRNQPSQWQTDLLIYSLNNPILNDLGCHLINEHSAKNQCFRIDYRSLWNRTDPNDNLIRSVQQHIPSWSRYLDSVGILLEQSHWLDRYDYILRTDIDVFLTPAFAHYIPFDCSFQIGLGGYDIDYAVNKLSRIGRTLNLHDAKIKTVGSTWYAPPRQAVLAARVVLWLSVWLSKYEFTTVEKNQRLSILSWPQWYIGVLSMYASHLSLNHLAGGRQINLIQKKYLLDYTCTVNTSFADREIIHIHAWHTSEMFSKFLFRNGSYDHLLRARTEWNSNYSLDFILRIVWQSKQMTLNDLFQLRHNRKVY